MTGELEQCIVLTAFGNAMLATPAKETELLTAVPQFTFSHVGIVRFSHASVKGQDAFREWIAILRKIDARRLWLGQTARPQFLQSHTAEAFANANPRFITAQTPTGLFGWTPHWEFGKSKSWTVTFNEIEAPYAPVSLNLHSCLDALRQAITEIRDFSKLAAGSNWTRIFDDALKVFEKDDRATQLPLIGYSTMAHTLLKAAASAWVFGGMGSWNDIWFEDDKLTPTYTQLTENLYNAIIGSVMSATNSFDASKKRT